MPALTSRNIAEVINDSASTVVKRAPSKNNSVPGRGVNAFVKRQAASNQAGARTSSRQTDMNSPERKENLGSSSGESRSLSRSSKESTDVSVDTDASTIDRSKITVPVVSTDSPGTKNQKQEQSRTIIERVGRKTNLSPAEIKAIEEVVNKKNITLGDGIKVNVKAINISAASPSPSSGTGTGKLIGELENIELGSNTLPKNSMNKGSEALTKSREPTTKISETVRPSGNSPKKNITILSVSGDSTAPSTRKKRESGLPPDTEIIEADDALTTSEANPKNIACIALDAEKNTILSTIKIVEESREKIKATMNRMNKSSSQKSASSVESVFEEAGIEQPESRLTTESGIADLKKSLKEIEEKIKTSCKGNEPEKADITVKKDSQEKSVRISSPSTEKSGVKMNSAVTSSENPISKNESSEEKEDSEGSKENEDSEEEAESDRVDSEEEEEE
ncbi:hypothetical protein BB560_003447 [Smittium megazygosporum]|uniref:Uncharacterized protein n=1 Tax=Smittium megazygosporum TaxID=133381 RepID=A0A2T9ZBY2_9FUNG|nr:hypothetical protein BB560_003447 [Smittium megazygosporum]